MNLKETNNNPPPAAAEALPVLDYAQPKPVVSVWQLVEILSRY